ncbi:MAG: Rhs element Vgr protein [Acidobacteria bacterium]|nr:MAG: Rhs element Vgr protein [Acidobacteriota bacterium]
MSSLPFAAATDVVTLTISVDGTELPRTVPMLGVEVLSQANRIPYARLRIGDGDSARGDFARSSGDLFVPGGSLSIKAGYHGKVEPIFSGVVLTQRIVVRRGSSWLEVEARDAAFAMTLVRKNRYFEKQSDSDVVAALLSDYSSDGISAGDITSTSVVHPQLLQYQATDWDFMISRLEAAGQICFVDGGTISSSTPSLSGEPVADVGFGATVLELDAEIDARTQTGGVRALAWDPSGQSLLDVSATDPQWSGNGNLSADTLSGAAGRKEDLLWHGGALASDELQSIADGAMLRARLAATCGRVRFPGVTAVKPGSVLTLSRLSDRFNGTVYVTGVRHEFSGGNWTTDAEFGMPRETHAERVSMSHVPAAGLAPAVHGLQVGIVTELAGDPGKEHRIRVKVPLAGMDEQGVWARVATLDAGDQRGTVFRPEKTDEVVLGFFHGDPAQPVVLGMLHSSAKAPPLTPTDDNDEKGYVSRSKVALKFDDKKKVAILETPGGNRLTLSDDDGGITLEDQNGNAIVMSKDGISLKSDKKAVTIKAKSDLKVEATNAEIKATSGATVKGGSKAEISSSGQLTVKGSMVMIN